MGLKRPEDYVASLRDGRVTYWDGERIDDITMHPQFSVRSRSPRGDYDYADPARRALMTLPRPRTASRRTGCSRSRATRPTSRSASN